MNLRLFFTIIFLHMVFRLPAAGVEAIKVDETANGKYLTVLLNDFENKFQVDFLYFPDELSPYKIYGVTQQYTIKEFLIAFLTEYYTIEINPKIIAIISKSRFGLLALDPNNFIILKTNPTNPGMISGHLQDIYSKEPLVGGDVVISSLNTGTRTDVDGNFSIRVKPAIYQVDFRNIGYEKIPVILAFSPYGNIERINLSLFPSSTQLETVTIVANKETNVKSKLSGIERLGIETIKSMPTFMGEVDPIRSITTLPGVSTAGELSSGFNVRGGEAGQNLILQDGAVIYNPTHLFGLFSAFNSDMVSNINLYKGGGPANFGGRASSVLDIDLKNGNMSTLSFSGGVGLVSSRLTLEGPIVKSKISFIIGGRISYSDWLVRKIKDVQLKNSKAKFHDLTAKVFFHPDEQDIISVSGYYSYDDFKLGNDSIFNWNTKNLTLKWDHDFKSNMTGKLSLASSNYESGVGFESGPQSFNYQNSINNLSLKYELEYAPSETSSYGMGVESSGSIIEPGKLTPATEPTNVIPNVLSNHNIIESAVFVQGNFDVFKNLGMSAGLRYSRFFRFGKGEIYHFDYNNLNGRYPSITDTIHFNSGELIDHYGGLEPRISIRYALNNSASLKASYYRTFQYVHLISNTITPSPLDYWLSSGPYIKPEIGDQFSLGTFKNLHNNLYEISLEGFYKKIGNALDYIEGANLILNEAPESGLSQGSGKAYGIEFQLKRKEEKFNGWISYTYSRSLRKYESDIPILNINSGAYYPSIFDQPHDLSVVVNYKIAARSTISMNFNYKSGRPLTIPVSKFTFGPVLSVLNYSDRNEYRMPNYNRLDLTLTVEDKHKRNQRYKGKWIFSVFNVYGRKNAYSIFFNNYGMAYKVSILGSVFPSISYDFKF